MITAFLVLCGIIGVFSIGIIATRPIAGIIAVMQISSFLLMLVAWLFAWATDFSVVNFLYPAIGITSFWLLLLFAKRFV